MTDTPALFLALLGIPEIVPGPGMRLPRYNKARSLLYLLAARPGKAHSREQLCEFLWPNEAHGAARANLRRMIHHLRDTLGPPNGPGPVQAEGEWVRLDETYPCRTDLLALDGLIAQAEGFAATDLALAESLHRGEFLQDWHEPSPAYEDWLLEVRSEYQIRVRGLFMRMAEDCLERGELALALRAAERVASLDPADGQGVRLLLKLFGLLGRHLELQHAYDRHRRHLQQDYDAEPEPETRRLYEDLSAAARAVLDRRDIPVAHEVTNVLRAAHRALLNWDFHEALALCARGEELLAEAEDLPTIRALQGELETLAKVARERDAAQERESRNRGGLRRTLAVLPEAYFLMRFAAWAGAESKLGPVKAERIARQLVDLAPRCGNWAGPRAEMALVLVLFWQGKFQEARIRAESVVLPGVHIPDIVERYGGGMIDIMMGSQLAMAALFCGDPETAAQESEKALALARLRNDVTSLGTAVTTAANIARWQQDPDRALALADELLAHPHGASPLMGGHARLLRHWALRRLGLAAPAADAEAGVEVICRLTPAMEPMARLLLAEAECAQGVSPAARPLIEAAIASGARHNHVHYHAELHRLLAEWHWRYGERPLAMQLLDSACAIAESQGNRLAMPALAATRRAFAEAGGSLRESLLLP